LHVSELADRYVHDPLSVVAVGQVVQVRVIGVDTKRGRVQLSMKVLQANSTVYPYATNVFPY